VVPRSIPIIFPINAEFNVPLWLSMIMPCKVEMKKWQFCGKGSSQ